MVNGPFHNLINKVSNLLKRKSKLTENAEDYEAAKRKLLSELRIISALTDEQSLLRTDKVVFHALLNGQDPFIEFVYTSRFNNEYKNVRAPQALLYNSSSMYTSRAKNLVMLISGMPYTTKMSTYLNSYQKTIHVLKDILLYEVDNNNTIRDTTLHDMNDILMKLTRLITTHKLELDEVDKKAKAAINKAIEQRLKEEKAFVDKYL